uniref:Uncharacterized protein n=1 Tax=Anguilla anguilla TaxID=7936 RepID=A0A0E9Q4X2_ANGAN
MGLESNNDQRSAWSLKNEARLWCTNYGT